MLDYNSVIGHEMIINHLKAAIEKNKISHAYLFYGEDGSGKKLLADIFAKTLQCERQQGEPCNVCKSCMQMDTNNHPDIIYVTHEKASLGVEDIRTQINNNILIKPFESPYKIYIVEDAHLMTEQAQNALLKTMEEPPAYAVIILLSDDINRLLPTIQSRSVHLSLKAVPTQKIKQFLIEKKEVSESLAEVSAQFARGNVGKALKYATSDEFLESKDTIIRVLRNIDNMSIGDILDTIKTFKEHKLEVTDYIDMMLLWYRDVLMFKVTQDPNLLLYKGNVQAIAKQAEIKNYEGIEKIIEALDKAKIRLKANVNFDIAIELMLLSLKEN